MNTVTVTSSVVSTVAIEIGAGEVRLRPSESGSVTGEIEGPDSALERVTIREFGGTLRITTPQRTFGSGTFEIDLAVPTGTDLELLSGSADVQADVALGTANLRSGSGDLQISACRSLSADTSSGDITVLRVDGDVHAGTGSGDLRIDSCDGTLELRTASGDIAVGSVTGRLESKTASGEVRVGATTGQVAAKTASGDIVVGVADDLPAWLDLSTASGDVRVELDGTSEPGPGEPYVAIQAVSGSGDITIRKAALRRPPTA